MPGRGWEGSNCIDVSSPRGGRHKAPRTGSPALERQKRVLREGPGRRRTPNPRCPKVPAWRVLLRGAALGPARPALGVCGPRPGSSRPGPRGQRLPPPWQTLSVGPPRPSVLPASPGLRAVAVAVAVAGGQGVAPGVRPCLCPGARRPEGWQGRPPSCGPGVLGAWDAARPAVASPLAAGWVWLLCCPSPSVLSSCVHSRVVFFPAGLEPAAGWLVFLFVFVDFCSL